MQKLTDRSGREQRSVNDKICVILVNYNGKKYNEACIESVLKSTCKESLCIAVVDNASTDGSLERLKEVYADKASIHYINMDDNYGFSRANNEGIKWALSQNYKYVMLLNNDTEIEPWTIEKMISLQRATDDVVVPKILYADKRDTIWCAGGELSSVIMKPKHRGTGEKDKGQYDRNERCTFANGCCILLTDQMICELGLLNEKFFLYYEDTEYSMRAKERGIGISYCGEAIVYHKVNGSTKGNENPANAYYISRNWLICNKLHMKAGFSLFCLYYMLNRFCWIMIWFIKGRKDLILAVWKGISDFRKGIDGKYKE